MKKACFTGLCALTTLLPPLALALEWNSGITAGRRDGTWDNGTTPNWNNTAGADPSTNTTWSAFFGNFTEAAFNAPEDGTVTVNGTVRTSNIQAGNGGDYTLDGGTINKFFGNLTIDVGTSGSGTLAIGSTLSNGLVIKQGAGRLSLFGTTTGSLRIDDGLVVLSSDVIPDGSDLEVRAGTRVRLDGSETVNELRLDGTLSGTGTLTAATYSLRDGALVDGYLGEGDFIKADAGTVTLNGFVSSDVIAVPEGTLVLSGNNIADDTRVSTSGTGTLEVNGDDTVSTYTQSDNGAITGIGTLATSAGAILNGGVIAGDLSGKTTVRGNVLVSGRTSGDSLTLENGTLTVTGETLNSKVLISPGTTFLQQGEFSGYTTLTNNGTLTVDSPSGAQVDYIQNPGGLLNGSGSQFGSATLNGGDVAGTLRARTMTSAGDVLVSGSTEGGSLDLPGGTLTLTGVANHGQIRIHSGAELLHRGSLSPDDLLYPTDLTNSGTLTMELDDSVDRYQQDPGALLGGSGTLTVESSITLDGGEIAGSLFGNTTSAGDVLVSGSIGGDTLDITGGTLTLDGTSSHTDITIAAGATLTRNGSFNQTSSVTNSGTFGIDGQAVIDTYVQNPGGLLVGPGALVATDAILAGGEISGRLGADATVTGDVTISGGISGIFPRGELTVDGGHLNLTGTASNLDIFVRDGSLTLSGDNIGGFSTLSIDPAGQLKLDGSDTVASISIAGTVDGPGTLTAASYDLLDGAVINGHLGEGEFIKGDNGTVTVNGTLASDSIAIPLGTVVLSGNNLEDTADVTTNDTGTLHLNGSETVDTYTQNDSGMLSGAGTLTATGGATLNGGEVSGSLAGNTLVRGDVLVSGSTSGDTLTLENGTLTVTGRILNQDVKITPDTTLRQQGDFSINQTVTNQGTLTVDSDTRTNHYVQSPGALLNGSGTLRARSTLNGGEVAGILDGDVTSTGDVLISGDLTGRGAHLYLDSGTLTLTGSVSHRKINLASGATILNRGDLGRSYLENSGVLINEVDDTIYTYSQDDNGRLQGPGILSTEGFANLGGGEVAGHLRGDTTSSGTVLVSGSIGGGALDITAGTLTLTGVSTNDPVRISSGAILLDQGDLADTANIINAGTLTVDVADTIGTYISNGATLDGTGTLTATGGATLTDGSLVTGSLDADTTTQGEVLVSGMIGGGSLRVADGTLTLTGSSTSTPVTILGDAALVDAGDLGDTAHIVMGGTLTTDVVDTVRSYLSDGGLLDGTGTLITTGTSILNGSSTVAGTLTALGGATLNNLSTITGLLTGDTTMNDSSSVGGSGVILGNLTSTGADVTIAGLTEGGHLDVTAGMLTVTGSAFNPLVTIRSGARVIDQSANAFIDTAELTNRGVLVLNGSETVGSYHNSPTGALQVTVDGPVLHDRLVADTVNLAPGSALILEKTELLLGQVADIIDGAIDGTFARIDALAGTGKDLRYAFNPNTGSIQALPGRPLPPEQPSDTLYNLSANQTQVIGTAFDDTYLDPATTPGMDTIGNFRRIYYRDTGHPDPAQRWQEIQPWQGRPGDTYTYDLDPGLGRAPVAPGSQAALLGDAITLFQASYDVLRDEAGAPILDAAGNPIPIVTAPGLAIANALSPQVHQGMADFTRQAMRSQLRTAMRTAPMATAGKGSMFAAIHSTSAGSDGGVDGASYDIDMEGAVAGLRYEFVPNLQVGAMLGMLGGDIKGSQIDTDGKGIMFGLFGEYLLDPATRTILSSSLAYGSYEYDAKRRSFGGSAFANDIDSDAWEFAIGIESVVYRTDRFRVIPRGAMRYLNGDVDGFKEQGQGVRMDVHSIKTTSLLLELGVDAEFDVNECFTLRAHLGGLTDLKGSGGYVSGSYLGGGLPVGVSAPGIDGEAFIFGLGGSYELNEATRFDLNWRSEVRDGSQNTHLFSLGTRVTF